MTTNISRRTALASLVAAGAVRGSQANSAVRVGVIGTGNRGRLSGR